MKEKIEKLYNLKQKIKELQEEEKKLKEEVKSILIEKPEFRLDGKVVVQEGEFKVTLSKTERVGVDVKGLKKEYPTIFEQFKTVSVSERLNIKKI